jgi:hypothetical protein
MRTDTETVPFDAHGVAPIPPGSRDCTPREQFWIWAGANLAPINWVLGALGITLGLSLLETLLVVAIGNLLGCAAFGLFNVIGHRTAVNQMVLGRAAFGRRGAAVPGLVQCLLTMAWVGVNTWVVLDLVLAILGKLGVHGGVALEYLVAAVIMIVQLGLALYGFYAIRTFEKYTVPATVAVMAVMSVLALSQAELHWTAGTTGREGHRDHPADDRDRHRVGAQLAALLGGLQPVRPAFVVQPGGVLVVDARHVRADGVARRPRRLPGQCGHRQRPVHAGDRHLRHAGRTGAAADHARTGRHQHPEPVLLLARRVVDRGSARPAGR